MDVLKVVVIGPESTGKSVLCKQLAEKFRTMWCTEYAREYLLENGTAYTYDDLLTIAKKQLIREDECAAAVAARDQGPGLLFVDTDMYVMKVWCEFVYNNCHRLILDQIIERKYDLYLLCGTDMPWVKDELREYPDLETRNKLYYMYKDLMVNQDVPFVEISGDYTQRLPAAISAVEAIFSSHGSAPGYPDRAAGNSSGS